MSACCICGIDYTPKSSGITFHKIPKNIEKRSRWITKIEKKICNFSHTASSVICSQHFEKECFTITGTGKFTLKSNAVPTIFMPLKAKYKVYDIDEEIEPQNMCENITKDTSRTYPHERHSESTCEESIPETSTQRKYSVHDMDEEIEPQNTCENITEDTSRTYRHERYSKSSCEESIPGISTQRIKTIYLPKKHRMTKFGTSQSATVENMECNEDDDNVVMKIYNNIELQHAQETIKQLRRKLKVCQQKCRRYKKKMDSLILFIKHLQDGQSPSRDDAEILAEFIIVGDAGNMVLVEQHDEL